VWRLLLIGFQIIDHPTRLKKDRSEKCLTWIITADRETKKKKNTTKYWLTGLVTAVKVPKIPKLEVDHRFGDTQLKFREFQYVLNGHKILPHFWQ
jgi:hypothetical protein